MKKKTFTTTMLTACVFVMAMGQATPPLVYNVENTGASCPAPPLPDVDELPSVVRLPNPFEWSDGSGIMTTVDQWACRRAEIKAEIEHYEIGLKPERPENITASYEEGVLTVVVTKGDKTVTLTSNVTIPEGTGPFPVIIGMNSATGSLSASYFQNCVHIPFMHNQVAAYGNGNKDLDAPFYQMYPELSSNGDYSAWAWGVSRLIDGIEMVRTELNVNMERIAVTGCSYAGKMALFAGAFDERVALTIAQESGGGGSASWRVSETLGSVEKISSTNYSWFMPALRDNFNGRVEKLPYDHHELMAMVAPRALLVLGNDGWEWMADESGYVACMGAMEVWKLMGIEDRFGFDFTGGHNHCQACDSQNDAVSRFVNRFLYGDDTEDTAITTHPYSQVNHQFWISEWADVTEPDVVLEQYWYEAESASCSTIGSDLVTTDDNAASNGKYVTVKSGLNSLDSAPDDERAIIIPVTVNNHKTFDIYFRLNCPSDNQDSFWVQIDNGDFIVHDGLNTNGEWTWVHIASPSLLAGSHTIKIAFRESGAKLDRIHLTNHSSEIPEGMGGVETDCRQPPTCTIFDFESGNIDGWTKQNPGAGIDITQEDKHSGVYALKMVNGSGTDAWSVQAFTPEVEIVSGHDYNVSFWVRAVDGEGRGRISTTGSGQLGGQYWADFNLDDEWTQVTYPNLKATGSTVQLAFDMGYVSGKTYYIDDIVFEDTTADPAPLVELQGETSWDAGEVFLNTVAESGIFGIRNIGNGTLEITNVTALSAPWATTFENGLSLTAGQVKEFTFTYRPAEETTATTDFTIHTNGGDVTIHLSGQGRAGTGIDDTDAPDIKVFSPASGKIDIYAPRNSGVKTVDMLGRILTAGEVADIPLQISLNPGVYLVLVEVGAGSYTYKTIVQ
ncbi:MAG: carbohydrate binding domain-containing protein [Prevotellaceae bacterium]|jgi:hypothetical protein|nr:carbohydrate binding domain-containing protein [Prevotellaceae bacterium]